MKKNSLRMIGFSLCCWGGGSIVDQKGMWIYIYIYIYACILYMQGGKWMNLSFYKQEIGKRRETKLVH